MNRAPQMIARIGAARLAALAVGLFGMGIALVATAAQFGVAMVIAGLCGAAFGALDVSMNSHAADLEARAKRPIMSTLHAMFSGGTLAGAMAYAALARGGMGSATILPKTGRRDYQPDFRLTESGIYIEHSGVRRQKTADGRERLVTAPFVDRDEYLAGMEWKRQIHAENETNLIETYSYERQEGRLLTGLAEKLTPYVTLNPLPANTIYDRIVELKQVDDFSKLLGTFLRKFKSGGYTLTILASNARPSSFITELREDPAYGIAAALGAEANAHVCGECGGRLLGVTGKDGRIWYRCEHVQHCGNLLPACPSCGTALPRRSGGTTETRCDCGASYPTCPACANGWLVERSGTYGTFLGCVRYPNCTVKVDPGRRGRSANVWRS